jgi:hypothetical protein
MKLIVLFHICENIISVNKISQGVIYQFTGHTLYSVAIIKTSFCI